MIKSKFLSVSENEKSELLKFMVKIKDLIELQVFKLFHSFIYGYIFISYNICYI